VATSFYDALHDQTVTASGLQGTYSATARLVASQPVTIPLSNQPSALEPWQITAQGNVAGPGGGVVQEVATITRQQEPLMNFAAFATSSACGAVNLGG